MTSLLWVFLVLSGTQVDGEKLFKSRCAMCHGQDGQGDPSIARLMTVEFKPMNSDYVQQKTDSEITEIITKGRNKMVPVRGLTAGQIKEVIAYLRSLRSRDN